MSAREAYPRHVEHNTVTDREIEEPRHRDAWLGLSDRGLAHQSKPKEQTARYVHSETCNPASAMITEGEVVVAAALIAFIVTFVTVDVLDRWRRN